MLELDNKLSTGAASPISGHLQLDLNKSETQFLVEFPDGYVLGEINVQLEKALTNIVEQRHQLEFEVFAPTRATRETISRATKGQEAVIRVQLNVYGPRASAESVGRELSQHKAYLQRPDYVRNGAVYENPHVLEFANHQHTAPISPIKVDERIGGKAAVEAFQQTITDVYSSLTRDRNLKGLEGDKRLLTSLLG
jgi:SWI/SNF-related matrix-associated actin-dependent regulator of chromatin subfamily A3